MAAVVKPVETIEVRELSQDELKELIREEARHLKMTYDQALKAAKAGSLPRNHWGADIELLVGLLQP